MWDEKIDKTTKSNTDFVQLFSDILATTLLNSVTSDWKGYLQL